MHKNQKQILKHLNLISTIDVPPGVPGVSKDAPGSTDVIEVLVKYVYELVFYTGLLKFVTVTCHPESILDNYRRSFLFWCSQVCKMCPFEVIAHRVTS